MRNFMLLIGLALFLVSCGESAPAESAAEETVVEPPAQEESAVETPAEPAGEVSLEINGSDAV